MDGSEIDKYIKTNEFLAEVKEMLEQDSIINSLGSQLSYLKVPRNDVLDSAKKELSGRFVSDLAWSGIDENHLSLAEILAGVKTAILNYQRQACFFYLVIDKGIKKFGGVLYKQYSLKCEYYEFGAVRFAITNHTNRNNPHFYGGNYGNMYAKTIINIKKIQGKELITADDFSTKVVLTFFGKKNNGGKQKYTTLEELSLEKLVEGIDEGN